MSQAGEIDVIGTHPEIPTEFIADSGTAVPIANTLELLGEVVANNNIPFRSVASGNTVTYQVQYAGEAAATGTTEAGIASFDSSAFDVDANGFVTLVGGSSPNTKITTFNADGTWTIDPRTVKVDVYAWSGGSGGGAGRNGVSGSAAGGAGGTGNFMMMSFNASGLTSSPYAVTIGQGGAGAASQNGTNTAASPGAFGTPTTLGSIFTTGNASAPVSSSGALGRYNNNGVSAPSGNNGGNGTATGGSSGDSFIYYPYAGGSGGCGYLSGSPRTGLAGGAIRDGLGNTLVAGGTGGANTGGNGGDGNSPSADCPIHIGGSGGGAGGNDGGAVTPIAGNGGNGGFPGGGGGGGAGNLNLMASGAGGNGGNGQLKIVEYF